MRSGRTPCRQAGSASIELIATLPFLLLAVAVAVQLVLAGEALWSAAIAARAGSRATLVDRNAAGAARAALPPSMRRESEVEEPPVSGAAGAQLGSDPQTGFGVAGRAGAVSVRVPIPRILDGLPRAFVTGETWLGPSHRRPPP